MKRSTILPWSLWAAAVVLLIGLVSTCAKAADASKPFIVEIVEFQGEIGSGMAASAAKMVESINDNPRIKAVVLVVNTPGGGAVASAAIYEELGKLKVPVIGWCDHLCASGGMYLLMAPSVKFIGVRSETIAGSIGVIGQITRFNRLLEWAKIDNETYTSGSHKDMGNPTRAAREEEKKYIQGIINELALRFYEVVGKSRKITDWDAVKTGRIFIGAEAVKVGLADAVLSREAVIAKAKELSGQKLIFTRDEMKKMSSAADAAPVVYRPTLPPMSMGDTAWLIETLKEIRQGDSVTFAYRLPYRF